VSKRGLRLVVLVLALAAVLPASASAAAKMWVGFQDDPSFRWRNDRDYQFLRAKNAHATVATTTLSWWQVAPTRPARPGDPFDPAYNFTEIDSFVRDAQKHGLESMLRIWGTPTWAGQRRNALPRRLSDLTAFTTAAASRYSGRFPGYPHVRFWVVWNEPNLNQFLTPQFDRRRRSVAPANYARLFSAAYTGIKRGNSTALVGLGETSARGRDRRVRGLQDTHSPGRFLELVAKAAPRLKFDAVGHHPYPTDPRQRPEQIVRWPNVSLASLPRLELSLRKWFKRTRVPIWITEYSHETIPDPRGVPYEVQDAYLRRAFALAQRLAYVEMFIWFGLHDDPGNPWQSGLIADDETVKPSYYTLAALAFPVDPRNSVTVVNAGRPNPVVRISALEIAAESPVGSRVGVDIRVVQGDSLIAHPQPEAVLGLDGWVTVPVAFTPVSGVYYLYVEVNDIHGNRVQRLLTLIARG
jgi:hypothetical protein